MKVFVTEDMVGHRLGEFAPTRTFRGHGGKAKEEAEVRLSAAWQKRATVTLLRKRDNESQTWHTKPSHRFARISARKVRPLADLIRGKHADEALDILRYQPQRGARMLEKVMQKRLGQRRGSPGAERRASLVVIDARVDGGPMFKRMRPGRAAWPT